jgi:hypothetical protein
MVQSRQRRERLKSRLQLHTVGLRRHHCSPTQPRDSSQENVDFLRERPHRPRPFTRPWARPKDLLRPARKRTTRGIPARHARSFGRRQSHAIGKDPAARPSGKRNFPESNSKICARPQWCRRRPTVCRCSRDFNRSHRAPCETPEAAPHRVAASKRLSRRGSLPATESRPGGAASARGGGAWWRARRCTSRSPCGAPRRSRRARSAPRRRGR